MTTPLRATAEPPARRLPRPTLRPDTWRQVQSWIHRPQSPVRDPHLTERRLQFLRLPPAFAGMGVVHLSDIHYGLYLSRLALRRVVDMTLALRPDLIALTGDFVTQSEAFIEPVCEQLARLRAPLGVYAVLGNHDFRAGAEPLTRGLSRRGITVLRNRHAWLQRNGARIKICGIDDSRQHPDLERALGPCGREFTLLLAHNPLVLPEAAGLGVDFVLSGHTHGGQIKIALAAPLYRRFAPAGHLRLGCTQMYVSRGVGKVILPVRVGCPSELASFRLYPDSGTSPES